MLPDQKARPDAPKNAVFHAVYAGRQAVNNANIQAWMNWHRRTSQANSKYEQQSQRPKRLYDQPDGAGAAYYGSRYGTACYGLEIVWPATAQTNLQPATACNGNGLLRPWYC